jgi:hypothetical protein
MHTISDLLSSFNSVLSGKHANSWFSPNNPLFNPGILLLVWKEELYRSAAMVCKSGFTSFSSCVEDGIGVNVEEVVVTASRVHCHHSMLALFCGNDFTTIFENQCIRLEIA